MSFSFHTLVSAFHFARPVQMPANKHNINQIWCRLLRYILCYRLLQIHQCNLHQATDSYTCATSCYKQGGTSTRLQLLQRLHDTTDLTSFSLMSFFFPLSGLLVVPCGGLGQSFKRCPLLPQFQQTPNSLPFRAKQGFWGDLPPWPLLPVFWADKATPVSVLDDLLRIYEYSSYTY